MEYIEGPPCTRHAWFAGERLTLADFQMSFAIAALLRLAGAAGANVRTLRSWLAARRGPPRLPARHRQGRPGVHAGLRLLPSGAAPSPGRNSAAIRDRQVSRPEESALVTTATPAPSKQKARPKPGFS
jgi:hypothetical protein